LGQLTAVGNISREAWDQRFHQMKESTNTYLVTVIEDTNLGRVRQLLGTRMVLHQIGAVVRRF
jgi:hypothetical protein